MEVMKDLNNLYEADVRWGYFGKGDATHLTKLYQAVESINLNTHIPESIRSQFNIAKMLTIYAWNYYPLNQVAKLKVYSVLEMALRERLQRTNLGLRKMLSLAIETDLINDQDFESLFPNVSVTIEYIQQLPEIISGTRNDLAHGSTTLTNETGIFTLQQCATIINALFKTAS